ncbi:hypothetical protein A2U01_0059705 [Trifolium medium]|uniref:Uncharacterized protein n=1 Tax=Trifolium medium TaxID=97028 RepID=A0A392RQJ6_9FABA|nr:hypothetical protein [Trifolium medium]
MLLVCLRPAQFCIYEKMNLAVGCVRRRYGCVWRNSERKIEGWVLWSACGADDAARGTVDLAVWKV